MPETNVSVTEYQNSDGIDITQFRTTVPKPIAEAFEMDGDTQLDWTVQTGDKLTIEVKNNE
jgi:hypothetical protein